MSNKPILDQVAHVAGGIVGTLPLLLHQGALTAAWAGFCMGFVRELTEQGKLVTWTTFKSALRGWQSKKDVIFWASGIGILAFVTTGRI